MHMLIYPLLAIFDAGPKFLLFGPLFLIAIIATILTLALAFLIPTDAPRNGNVASGKQLASTDSSIVPRPRYWTQD